MTETTTTAVQALMERALSQTSPAALLRVAAEVTRPKSPWKGPRKLSHDQALAATRLVTEMLHRFDLKPTRVLVSGGRASERGATSRFYLSRREMEPGAVVSKRLASGIGAYVDNVEAIARHARESGFALEDDALLVELAAVLDGYLDNFRGTPETEPDTELAQDVARIATWLASPGRRYELARFLAEAQRDALNFDVQAGAMEYVGDGAFLYSGNTPVVPLFTRVVAHAEAEVFRVRPNANGESEENNLFFLNPDLEAVGCAHCVICQKVGLAAVVEPGGRALRMVFTMDPATYVGEPQEQSVEASWASLGYGCFLPYTGYPEPDRTEALGETGYWFRAAHPHGFECPDFETHYRKALDRMAPGHDEGLWLRRHVLVSPEACRLLLPDEDRSAFDLWRSFADLPEESVLPGSVTDDAGVESRTLRARFAALLYAEAEPSLAGLLDEEARKRADAMEAFRMRSASGERRRREAFRARMRR
ncbi:hypothetical protein [Methylobacterium sp. 88A]|uniref:hypothetical protein n=1 Tax=Methylobacterium sp. 88A TaxID=1131813 RepID=UPI0003739574|nr:hypothetical protein [Methylobacterium sp. 88A]